MPDDPRVQRALEVAAGYMVGLDEVEAAKYLSELLALWVDVSPTPAGVARAQELVDRIRQRSVEMSCGLQVN